MRTNCLRTNFFRTNCLWGQTVSGQTGWGQTVTKDKLSLRTNCLRTNFSRTNCCRTNCLRTNCLRTNCLRTNCPRTNCYVIQWARTFGDANSAELSRLVFETFFDRLWLFLLIRRNNHLKLQKSGGIKSRFTPLDCRVIFLQSDALSKLL